MRVVVEGWAVTGPTVDLRDVDADGATVAKAVSEPNEGDATGSELPADGIRYEGPAPGPGHETLCRPSDGDPSLRATLAAAARSRGLSSGVDDEIEAVRSELAALSPPPTETDEQRRRLSEAGSEVERLRERAATLRGRLQARRELGAAEEPVAEELAAAMRRLSEAETERVAAEEALAGARSRAREGYERRERRLSLQDRLANRRREARRELTAAVYDRFRTALDAVPGSATAGPDPGSFAGERIAARYAAIRMADLDAPVVVESDDRTPEAFREALRAPVVTV